MKPARAFHQRILELCELENITLYELAKRAGLPKSTLLSAVDPERGNPSLSTVCKICDGLDTDLRTFFDSELFQEYF